jgi:hypothetical protein
MLFAQTLLVKTLIAALNPGPDTEKLLLFRSFPYRRLPEVVGCSEFARQSSRAAFRTLNGNAKLTNEKAMWLSPPKAY